MSAATVKQPGMSNAEYLRELRRRAVAEGKCYMCRCRPVRTGARYCDECIKRTAAYKDAIAYLLCLLCGADVAGLGVQHCRECSDRISERVSTVRAQRVLDGQCSLCPNDASPGQTMCVACLERLRLGALARNRASGAKPTNRCSICVERGWPGLSHNKRTHDRYMASAVQWRST